MLANEVISFGVVWTTGLMAVYVVLWCTSSWTQRAIAYHMFFSGLHSTVRLLEGETHLTGLVAHTFWAVLGILAAHWLLAGQGRVESQRRHPSSFRRPY